MLQNILLMLAGKNEIFISVN